MMNFESKLRDWRGTTLDWMQNNAHLKKANEDLETLNILFKHQ